MKEIDKKEIIRSKLSESRKSPLKVYKELSAGKVSFLKFIYYEFTTFFLGPLPGAIGFFLRKIFYPRMFRKTGRGLIIGRNVVIRHPFKISLGNNVTIDDYCLLDGRGGEGIILEDYTLLNRNCLVQAKTGHIKIGERTSIGCNSVIISMAGVEFGKEVLTGGNCYVSSGAYKFDALEKPIMDQPAFSNGSIIIGEGTWIGTSVTILDNVKIGKGSVIGALTLVNKDIEEFSIAAGSPAKILRKRGEKKA